MNPRDVGSCSIAAYPRPLGRFYHLLYKRRRAGQLGPSYPRSEDSARVK